MQKTDENWKQMLRGEHPIHRLESRFWRMIPANPRCKICFSPFAGLGGRILSLLGRRPWKKNPSICNVCQVYVERHRGGTETEITLLFADIRGSTAIAETMSATDYNTLLNTFFNTATKVLVDHVAWIDKYVGDEIVAFFFPNRVTGENHAKTGIDAARAVLKALNALSVPIGIGVHTGSAYVGTVGGENVSDVTAVGGDVNIAARLASAAEAGTILVSEAACAAAGLDADLTNQSSLQVKGKKIPIPVRVLLA